MAKVNVIGEAVVITSALKFDDIEFVQKYRPDALVLKGGEDGKEPIFKIAVGCEGDIGKYGATFSGKTRDENGFATITMALCCNPDDIKALIADKYGAALVNIGKLEEALPKVVEEIGVEREEILGHIEIA